ncbi:hypothetical protein AB1Y20_015268 [Prymnesium parvum]|uniref:PIPK domain-containing protein n=1 Tax=Prymnesium parvum TaxID=97485 RepID=A0AB34JXA9_PRYPA
MLQLPFPLTAASPPPRTPPSPPLPLTSPCRPVPWLAPPSIPSLAPLLPPAFPPAPARPTLPPSPPSPPRAPPSSPPCPSSPPGPPSLPPPVIQGVRLCNSLYAENASEWAGCAATDAPSGLCDVSNLHYCTCIALDPQTNPEMERAVEQKVGDASLQAHVQLALALTSVIACCAFLACYALLPERMWVYPLNLAFWIYVCDLLVAVQFLVVSAEAVVYTRQFAARPQLFPIGTNPDCLCEFSPHHPGCACRNGFLSFVMQVGLIGGVLFYCSLAHNLYRSVDDPFTRPSSRLPRYHLLNWTIVLLLALPYTSPPGGDAPNPDLFSGYGYQADFQMCWSPVRYGSHIIGNPQVFLFATIPIFITVFVAPIFHYAARRLLLQGGETARSMLEPRVRQVRKAQLLLRIHSAYWVLTGLLFILTAASDYQDPIGECRDASSVGECTPSRLKFIRPCFSALLCLQGSVHACVGAFANRSTLASGLHELRQRVWEWTRGADKPPVLGEAEAELEDDISQSLRLDIISFTMRGIQCTSGGATAPRGGARESDTASMLHGAPSDHSPHQLMAALDLHVAADEARGISGAASSRARSPGPHDEAAGRRSEPLAKDGVRRADFFPLREAFDEVAQVTLAKGAFRSDRASQPHGLARAESEALARLRLPSDAVESVPSQRTDRSRLSEAVDEGRRLVCCGARNKRDAVVFKSFAPRVWQWLRREVYGVETNSYVHSFDASHIDGPASLCALANFSEAKGGGFFFFSPDKRYMIKSLDAEEHHTLMQILPSYCKHMCERPTSLLTKISGCYAITMYGHTKYFYVQDYLFHGCPNMDELYDLKGSWIKRNRVGRKGARLDNDWLPSRQLNLPAAASSQLLSSVEHDCKYLRGEGLMDYSLLLGIHNVKERRNLRHARGQEPVPLARESCLAGAHIQSAEISASEYHQGPLSFSPTTLEGPGLYRVGIIDMLQRWNWRKRAERFAKIMFHLHWHTRDKAGLSAIEPRRYAHRFHRMVGCKLLALEDGAVQRAWEGKGLPAILSPSHRARHDSRASQTASEITLALTASDGARCSHMLGALPHAENERWRCRPPTPDVRAATQKSHTSSQCISSDLSTCSCVAMSI